jgi:ABC-2 type transport system ATP-binding protein
VSGYSCIECPEKVRQAIGYLAEDPPGYADARVVEYLSFRAQLKGIAHRDRRSEIDRCLEACQLTAVRRRLIGRLSQGFRRRVGLADALLAHPRVLILDEPTIGLDPLQTRHFRELLADVAREATVLLSTHLLGEAEGLCERVLVLMQGRLVSDVRMADLHRGTGFEIEIAGPRAECEEMLRGLPHVTSVEHAGTRDVWHTFFVAGGDGGVREQAARNCMHRGWGLRELRAVAGTLEEHFVRLTMRARPQEAA